MPNPQEADVIVGSLSEAMADGETGLRYVPALLLRVINEDMWQRRVIAKTGQVAEFKSFREFVETQPLEGLGADLDTLKRLCTGNMEALDAIIRMTQQPKGRPSKEDKSLYYDDLSGKEEQGTSAAYALRKLRADAPEIHARVLAGELSPHAAMIEAGYRRKTIQIPADPEGVARALKRRFSADELQRIAADIIAE
jgi:hypothetical protein